MTWIIDLDALEHENTPDTDCPACRGGCVDRASHVANLAALLDRTARQTPRHERHNP